KKERKKEDILQMRTLSYWLTVVMIGLMPWMDMVHLPGMGTLSRVVGLGTAAFWLFVVVFTGKVRKPVPFHLLALLFLFWTTATIFWSVGVDRTWDRAFIYIRMVGMALMIWDLYDAKSMVQTALQAYVIGAYVHAGSVLYNYWLGAESVYGRYAAAGNIANTTAYVLGIALPVAWYLSTVARPTATTDIWERIRIYLWQTVNLAYVPIALTAIALSATRFGIIMAIPACLYGFYGLLRTHRAFGVVSLLALVGGIVFLMTFVPDSSFQRLAETGESIRSGDLTGRVELWRIAQEAWEGRPVIGIGSDAFPSFNRSGRAAHNTYLVILVETGVIGLVCFLTLLVATLVTAWRLSFRDSLFWLTLFAVWGVSSLVLNLGHDKSFWLFLSLVVAQGRIDQVQRTTATVTEAAGETLSNPMRAGRLLPSPATAVATEIRLTPNTHL
ncbi:MAG: O-antigen ligase family protein, partial [Caldilineaceae bacterium]|nr:O-antigen ligase family protein [Caldilineaceae bacterium]